MNARHQAAAFKVARLDHAASDELKAHLHRLDSHDRYLRFGRQAVSNASLNRYVDAFDFEQDRLLGVRDRRGRLVAVAEILRCGTAAELAFSVEAGFQRRGLGRALLAAACDEARRLGMLSVRAQCVPGNIGMRKLLATAGWNLERDNGEIVATAPVCADDECSTA